MKKLKDVPDIGVKLQNNSEVKRSGVDSIPMKSYLGLTAAYEKVHRKRGRITVLCIALSVCLVTAIFSMADMAVRSQINYFIKTGGNYHVSLHEIDEGTAAQIAGRTDVAAAGWVYQGSTGSLGGKSLSFAGAGEKAFSEMTEMSLASGAYPQKAEEALLNETAMENLGLTIGDEIKVTIPDGTQKTYLITGICNDLGTLLKADAYGMILSEDGFCQIADENAKDGSVFRIQFKKGISIKDAIADMEAEYRLAPEQFSENTVLLGLLGESENSLMRSLYLVAALLVLLVLAAGTVMISAGFNTEVLWRIQFYGLLRCLGATGGQVKRYVIIQGLRQSLRGVPVGLAAGQGICWCACALLKAVNSSRFSEIPQLAFSGVGLSAGIIVGFLIVLLAALSPARKAAAVPPATAVSGNEQTERKGIHALFSHVLPVDTGMGISHAFSGRKNMVLMTCSFALSISLFLAFYVCVIFLNQAMPSLQPSAADLSITAGEYPLDSGLINELETIPGVETVYGRKVSSPLETVNRRISGHVEKAGGAEEYFDLQQVMLVSYDANQFRWAKEDLTEGNMKSAEEPGNVLAVYGKGMPWKEGDVLTLHTPAGEKEVRIAGILSDVYTGPGKNGVCLVCSEENFYSIVGNVGYAEIDLKLNGKADNGTAAAVRKLLPADAAFSDKRLHNAEARDSYFSGAVFIYGFLFIIALITVFQIFNSMNASVAARTKQYGMMRAIGMSDRQLVHMIKAESLTYAITGCIAGCIVGLPLNKAVFGWLIQEKWGTSWQLPFGALLVILLLCLVSAELSIRQPVRKICGMAIVDTINKQQ